MALDDHGVLRLREAEAWGEFLESIRQWVARGKPNAYLSETLAERWARRDTRTPRVNRALASGLSVTVAEALGQVANQLLNVEARWSGVLIDFVVGLLPWITVSIRHTRAKPVFELAAMLGNAN